MTDKDYSIRGRHREPPRVLVERVWRLQNTQGGAVLSCGLYLHPLGIEARCGHGNEDDLLMSHVEKTLDAAKAQTDAWREAAIAKGFTEVKDGH